MVIFLPPKLLPVCPLASWSRLEGINNTVSPSARLLIPPQNGGSHTEFGNHSPWTTDNWTGSLKVTDPSISFQRNLPEWTESLKLHIPSNFLISQIRSFGPKEHQHGLSSQIQCHLPLVQYSFPITSQHGHLISLGAGGGESRWRNESPNSREG